jgi:hypothetical protein
MLSIFISGFVVGFLVKKHLNDIVYNIIYTIKKTAPPKDGITKITFVCKLRNNDPVQIQPYWKFFSEKRVIKIDLTSELIKYFNKNITFNDIFELRDASGERLVTIYLPYFQDLGTVYLYFTYNSGYKEYINVYSPHDTIDFKIKNTSDCICSCIKYNGTTEYITEYYQKFCNTPGVLTPEMLLLNYNYIDINPELITLHNINTSGIKCYKFDEVI